MENIFEDLTDEEIKNFFLDRRCKSEMSVRIWENGDVVLYTDKDDFCVSDANELNEIGRKSKLFCDKRLRYKERMKNENKNA